VEAQVSGLYYDEDADEPDDEVAHTDLAALPWESWGADMDEGAE
jgi:hypothetical protein